MVPAVWPVHDNVVPVAEVEAAVGVDGVVTRAMALDGAEVPPALVAATV